MRAGGADLRRRACLLATRSARGKSQSTSSELGPFACSLRAVALRPAAVRPRQSTARSPQPSISANTNHKPSSRSDSAHSSDAPLTPRRQRRSLNKFRFAGMCNKAENPCESRCQSDPNRTLCARNRRRGPFQRLDSRFGLTESGSLSLNKSNWGRGRNRVHRLGQTVPLVLSSDQRPRPDHQISIVWQRFTRFSNSTN